MSARTARCRVPPASICCHRAINIAAEATPAKRERAAGCNGSAAGPVAMPLQHSWRIALRVPGRQALGDMWYQDADNVPFTGMDFALRVSNVNAASWPSDGVEVPPSHDP